MFKALVMEQNDEGVASAAIRDISEDQLPEGSFFCADRAVAVTYKDGLCLSSKGGGLVRKYPHVPGIDFAGTVEASQDDRYRPGDKVVASSP